MRNVLALLFFLAVAGEMNAQTADNSDNERNLATVNTLQGLQIFTDCKPLAQYEYIATVKKTNWSGVYDKLIIGAIKNAKEECPEVQALIVNFKPNGTIQADCIKFK